MTNTFLSAGPNRSQVIPLQECLSHRDPAQGQVIVLAFAPMGCQPTNGAKFMETTKRAKILYSAIACDPNMGSEPYVGWNWPKMVSDSFDVHVVTRRHHQVSIESEARLPNVTFHYFELPYCRSMDHRSRWAKPYAVLWQIFLPLKLLSIYRRFKFEVIHHITYNNVDLPGFLWIFPAQFVWGPVGGGQVPNPIFRKVYGAYWWKEIVRKILKQFAAYNPVVVLAARRAAMVLYANEDTERVLRKIAPKRTARMLETAIDDGADVPLRVDRQQDEPFRLLWAGRVEPRKALMIALDVMKRGLDKYSGWNDVYLEVVGDGPLLAEMQKYATEIGIQDRVNFNGSVDFVQMKSFFNTCHAHVFTSVQDTSGNVILEAMASGMPTIAFKHQGAAEILAEGGGILVPVTSFDSCVEKFADEIFRLKSTAQDYRRLSEEAKNLVHRKFSWKAKAAEVKEMYLLLCKL